MIRIQRRRKPWLVPCGVWLSAAYRYRRWQERHMGAHWPAPTCKGRRVPRLSLSGAVYTMPRRMAGAWQRRVEEGAWG